MLIVHRQLFIAHCPLPTAICHITVLNPVRHTRIFYKLALTQRELGHEVSIIGRGEQTEFQADQGVAMYCIQTFPRLSWKRFFYSWLILPKARKIKANVYTLHSPELLFLGLLLKLFLRAKILYDVHEDYAANIRGAKHYPFWLRSPLAWLVRRWERFAMRWVDAVSYAEACYENFLQLPESRRFILPNKFTPKAAQGSSYLSLPDAPYLLYTGTIAREWGLFEAIDVWEAWNREEAIQLLIAGHTHQYALLQELEDRIQKSGQKDRFQLIGGKEYVPYSDILHLIQHCRLGIGLYHILPHIQGKIPTKFYEFMAFDKPLLYPDDPAWRAFDKAHQLGIAWSKDHPIADIRAELEAWEANPPQHDAQTYQWSSQEVEKMLSYLFSKKQGPHTEALHL